MPHFNAGGSAPVQSVNGKIDDVVLDAADVGAVAANGGTATKTVINESKYRRAPTQNNVSGTVNLDYSLGDLFKLNGATGTVNLALLNRPSDATYFTAILLECVNLGGQTINWPVGSNFPAGRAPELSVTGRDFVAIVLTESTIDVYARTDLKTS